MGNGKIKCNLCNEEYSADACKSFTYGRLDDWYLLYDLF